MKRCPECMRDYHDETLSYCLDDGAPLVYGSSSGRISEAPPTEMLPTISDNFPSIDRWTSGRHITAESTGSRKKLTSIIVGLAIIIAAGAFFGYRYLRPSGDRINSMAVLPLRPLNDDENTKALGLGLTDALITKLGSLRHIVVRPTSAITSVSADNGSTELGKRLNVDAILEGTIQEANGRLRVNARLIRTSTGEQIWADKFEQPATNLFAIQDALSSSIAKALTFELTLADSEQLVSRGTNNNDAYEKYLRGRFYQTQNTAEGLRRSIEFYEQSVALDPGFAEAYAGIADANLILFNLGFMSREDTIPAARRAIGRALQLNPDLSNTHTSLALIEFLIDRDWRLAEKSLQRAIELNPSNADAYLRYGYFLINVGRFDDALEKLTRARELNPLSPIIQTNIGLAQIFSGRYSDAIDQLQKTAAENPQFPLAQWLLGLAYEEEGDLERSFDENLRALELEGGEASAAELRKVRRASGVEVANRKWLSDTFKEKLTASSTTGKGKDHFRIPALLVALRAATAKDRELTLYWIEKASEEADPTLAQIRFLKKFDFVRGDERFQAVARTLIYE